MAKKFGKFLAFAAIASAAAGAYYYLKNKNAAADEEDFDDFDEDDDISLEEYLNEEASQSEQTERSIKSIFPITLSAETVNEAKESLKKAVMGIGGKVAGVADSITGVVKPGSASSDVENFQFYDLSQEEAPAVPDDANAINIINMKKPSEDAAAADSASASAPVPADDTDAAPTAEDTAAAEETETAEQSDSSRA